MPLQFKSGLTFGYRLIKRAWKTVCWILFVCESETVVDREKEGCGGMVVVMAVMVDGVLRIGNFIN